jgi:hypothetical protein
MGIRRLRTDQGQPIEKVGPGDDVYRAVDKLYRTGRTYPGKAPHDYAKPQQTPEYKVPSPSRDERASYAPGKNSPMEPAPAEWAPQFRDDKCSNYNDTTEAWCRGMAKEQHPFFDKGGSGSRYRK